MTVTLSYENCIGAANPQSGVDIITAINKTGSSISKNDKVWIEPKGTDAYASDFTTYGSPTVDTTNGTMSSVSDNDLIYKNIDNTSATTRTIQLRLKFNDVSYVPTAYAMCRFMMNSYTGNFNGLVALFAYGTNYYWWFNGYSSGQEPRIAVFPNNMSGLQANTYYYIKIEFTDSSVTSFFSEDGSSWTQVETISISTINTYADESHKVFSLGGLDGTIIPTYDLTKCIYTVDGVEVWSPVYYDAKRFEVLEFSNITSSGFSGFAVKSIAVGANGYVKTVLE